MVVGKRSPVFRISEYLAASAVMASGVEYQGAVLDENQRVSFLFNNSGGQAETALFAHLNGSLQISSREMAGAITTLKDALFQTRRGAGVER